MTQVVQKFKQVHLSRQLGEMARIKVVSGPDVGVIFIVKADRITLGRGETCSAMISDLKASRLHAEIYFDGQGWNIKDVGSANGIKINGQFYKTSQLRSGDTFVLGESIFEFYPAQTGTQILTAPAKNLFEVQSEMEKQQQERNRVHAFGNFGDLFTPKETQKITMSGVSPKRLILFIVGGIAVFALLFLDPEEGQKSKEIPKQALNSKKEEMQRGLAFYLPTGGHNADEELSPHLSKSATSFFKSGFREYKAGNYLRAKNHFETVLQIDGNHRLAKLYLENSIKAIEEEVKYHLEVGKKQKISGKLQESKGHFESVLRLLYFDRSNPNFKEAADQLKDLEVIMKGES